MHVITRKRLNEFTDKHPDTKFALARWYALMRKGRFSNLIQLREVFPQADQVGKFTVSRGAKPRAAPGVHNHTEIRSDVRYARSKKQGATRGAAIIEGKNDKLIYRNESGDRRGDRLRHVGRGCHGPRVGDADFSLIPLPVAKIRHRTSNI
jgi:mRNA interferase HigB